MSNSNELERKMAWAKTYSLAGVRGGGKLPKELPPEAAKWRALALTKKSKLSIRANIPKCQFIGESQELNQEINNMITENVFNMSKVLISKQITT